MPEGPEVEFLSNLINKTYKNKILKKIDILSGRYLKHGPPKNYKEFVKEFPIKCLKVEKKGKVIFIYFENNWCIISKLGLSGWWFPINKRPTWGTKKNTIVFEFSDVESLVYSDQLSYGSLQFVNDNQVLLKEINNIAPDIKDITLKIFFERLSNLRLSKVRMQMLIEDAIVDQHFLFSGIGNYLKSEILYASKISPIRKLESLSKNDWSNILTNAKKITMKMLKSLSISPDAYMNSMQVYRKITDILGNKIETRKTKTGRTTFWVPSIQK